MNQKARVMDARRRLELAGDLLESQFDLVLEGELNKKELDDNNAFGNPFNRPFDFRRQESEFRGGIRLDTPLDQVAERNAFAGSDPPRPQVAASASPDIALIERARPSAKSQEAGCRDLH